MKDIARASVEELKNLIEITRKATGLSESVIEKDFWVCYTLDHLFHHSEFKDHIVFKGGTSLSKAFGLIARFSEDIDLILDWRLLGYGLDEPWQERSNTKQDKFKLESIERTNSYLADVFAPSLKASLSKEIGIDAIVYTADEEETVIFEYPRIYQPGAALDVIRLEIGPLAAWTPTVEASVTPYITEQRPDAFTEPSTVVTTVSPERSFWEKITILHQEANRPADKALLQRYSRHYYDVYRLGHSPVKDRAIEDIALLQKVVDFKMKFYRSQWARFEDCKPGSIVLSLPDNRITELASDYQAMQEFLIGERPSFDEIMDYLEVLQDEINSLRRLS
ncbi:MAG: nucleotidyl transferase AbiEii/AbiGii toxin family protein [Coriobacteriaceae bacterium]|nr:nucleotidyl transferase AbiEii/AbiGii toxin family protein [Coriobacteriaceae bacterium]